MYNAYVLFICMGTFYSPAEISKLDPISVLMFRLTREHDRCCHVRK